MCNDFGDIEILSLLSRFHKDEACASERKDIEENYEFESCG